MLCASVLAELEKATPVEQRPRPIAEDVVSEDSIESTITASEGTGTDASTTPTVVRVSAHTLEGVVDYSVRGLRRFEGALGGPSGWPRLRARNC